jgi:hypothetical protein
VSKKEQERVYKYASLAKSAKRATCPACAGIMGYETAHGVNPPSFSCVCGFRAFEFTGMPKPDFDMMALGAR